MPTDNPRKPIRRVTAVYYTAHPESGAPEMELIHLATQVSGHRTAEDFLRWAGLLTAQRVIKASMQAQQHPEEQQPDGNDPLPGEVQGDDEEEAGPATQAD